MEKRKISEENIFTKDYVGILKEIITNGERVINEISNDQQLTIEEKKEKLQIHSDELTKATEILNNPELLDNYTRFSTIADIDKFVTAIFGSTGLGMLNQPISISMINPQRLETQASDWNIDKENLIEFLRNKNIISVIEELYQKAGYKMPTSRFSTYNGNEYYEVLGYSTIPQIYDAITRLPEKYVPENAESKEKSM